MGLGEVDGGGGGRDPPRASSAVGGGWGGGGGGGMPCRPADTRAGACVPLVAQQGSQITCTAVNLTYCYYLSTMHSTSGAT